ncbi:hypothetical protein F9C07_2109042 [Aspergillus flavus]|uniref:Alcohol dehydrogenase-like C-terminal domain-containing protein n=1 Tax=Aspergillus flavus (strain ATCC 200026 / FGSC A1120 / IAM 13836 / NRRL 3357 / JCM 12722 / SRRC 167) TaxID=332952 RepID=A0A7U2N116_ASPFN|nr:uncharacterized protein G4B84_010103 [Aspergillus flavus NRRL3357]QMW34637.1 hypothetical protein G4B84_010103 [Aspergillus flavus NRRL3357]QRD93543.1 hypothetical protein F9C07_2109042 [Aspergillus flavus]
MGDQIPPQDRSKLRGRFKDTLKATFALKSIHDLYRKSPVLVDPDHAMKAALVTSWGKPPQYISIPDLPPPAPTQLQLIVLATSVTRVVRSRAASAHSTAFKTPSPYDPSVDGVAIDEITGDMLDERNDPVKVAALANPVSCSWMTLRCRVIGGCQGRTVLIIGATTASGRCAAIVACSLGATRIIGMSRNEETLAAVEGLDDRVVLREPFALPPSVGPVHIILDYIGNGPAASGILQTAQSAYGENLQYVQVGNIANRPHMFHVMPTYLINHRPLCILGTGIGCFTVEDWRKELPEIM